MCGIVGFVTKETTRLENDRSKFMRQGLIIDTLRGDDSAGVFAVGHEPLYDDGGAFWLKQLGCGYDFVNSSGYWESLYDTKEYRAVIGHNRAATVGAVDTDGAHPFQVGPITLVHNGTLTSTFQMPTPQYNIRLPDENGNETVKCEVDSHAIAYNLAHHDAEEVIAGLQGAFTLVWHDSRDDTVNIIRNSQRPLHMALSKQQDTLYFMSEAEMLHLLDRRLKLDLGPIYYPKPGQWLKWGPEDALDAPQVKTCELYTTPTYNSYRNGGGSSGNYMGSWAYDDDDIDAGWEDYNSGRYSQAMSGKGSALPQSDKIWVGGSRKDVPLPIQEALLEHDLMVEDRLSFTPKLKDDSGRRSSVIGDLDGKWKAILYNQTEASGSLMDRQWTVRPVGILVTVSGEPLVITKLVSTVYSEARKVSGVTTQTQTTSGDNPNEGDRMVAEWVDRNIDYCVMRDDTVWKKRCDQNVWHKDRGEGECPRDDAGRAMLGYHDELARHRTNFRGPQDRKLSADEYRAATLDGCAICYRSVGLQDADDIVWSIDGDDFICWDCDARGDHHFYSEVH